MVPSLFTARAFIYNHIVEASKTYDVTLITNLDGDDIECFVNIGVSVVDLGIKRQISIACDFLALTKLIAIFNKSEFDLVHSVTPKAGLLSMLAAWVVRVPVRVHIFTGQVWATKIGMKRFVLKKIDCLLAALTTHNLVDSPSQGQFLLDEGVVSYDKLIMFGAGSIAGVDARKFKPNPQGKKEIRLQLGIPEGGMVFLFIGRLTKDKGVLDLVRAFDKLNLRDVHLLLVGPDEQDIEAEIQLVGNDKICFVGHTNSPESYMAAADILCLPSYREGFGTVLIEAAAVGIPAIASRIYGISDAVIDLKTGLLHEARDVTAIKVCMERLIQNSDLRLELGRRAKERAIKDFDSRVITRAWMDFYQDRLD